jgi:hypothetical protein
VYENEKLLFNVSMEQLKDAWQKPMKEIFA